MPYLYCTFHSTHCFKAALRECTVYSNSRSYYSVDKSVVIITDCNSDTTLPVHIHSFLFVLRSSQTRKAALFLDSSFGFPRLLTGMLSRSCP